MPAKAELPDGSDIAACLAPCNSSNWSGVPRLSNRENPDTIRDEPCACRHGCRNDISSRGHAEILRFGNRRPSVSKRGSMESVALASREYPPKALIKIGSYRNSNTFPEDGKSKLSCAVWDAQKPFGCINITKCYFQTLTSEHQANRFWVESRCRGFARVPHTRAAMQYS
jgi:hypothetical protein